MQKETTHLDILSVIDFESVTIVESVLHNYRLIESLSLKNLKVMELKLEIDLAIDKLDFMTIKEFRNSVDDMDKKTLRKVALSITQIYCN